MIRLDLSKHCIETEIKKVYNQSVFRYFKAGSDKNQLENQIDILKKAMEQVDFAGLRRVYPELEGHNHSEVFLSKDAENRMVITINDQKIEPLICKKP